jgi:Tfp pilus assembly PilM family ATPase
MKKDRSHSSGLDIQAEYLTVAQYSAEDHAVTLVAIQPIAPDSAKSHEDAAGRELAALKTRFRFGDAEVNCSLAGTYAIVKKMPVDADETDVDAALSWELGQHIIGSVDEYAFDFEEYGTGADGLREFLVVAYRKEQVERLAGLLRRQKLTPGVIDIDMFALVNVFEANYPEMLAQPAMLLHAETGMARLVFTHHGKYVDHECFEVAQGIDPQTFGERLQEEVARLASQVTLAGGGIGVPIFAAGGLFVQPGYLEASSAAAGNVELLNPFNKIACRVGVDNGQLAAFLPQLSIAVGCALRGNE